jgi:2-C-methyl-D-erythritol 2,4-cyclodiphosphate synthase
VRVGIGYDSHRFAAAGDARKLILGGVTIAHPQGLVGHSDADAVAHALTDAILGAAGLGDIGRMFPATDPRWKNADSIALLNQAYLKVLEAGYEFVQADITVVCERPRLAPHVEAMQERLAGALITPPSAISVKAKTNEGMGWIGRGEGVAAIAVAQVSQSGPPRLSSSVAGVDL